TTCWTWRYRSAATSCPASAATWAGSPSMHIWKPKPFSWRCKPATGMPLRTAKSGAFSAGVATCAGGLFQDFLHRLDNRIGVSYRAAAFDPPCTDIGDVGTAPEGG